MKYEDDISPRKAWQSVRRAEMVDASDVERAGEVVCWKRISTVDTVWKAPDLLDFRVI